MFEANSWSQLSYQVVRRFKEPLFLWRVGLLGGGAFAMVIGGWLNWVQPPVTELVENCPLIESDSSKKQTAKITVDINGAIEKPGLYELDSGARYADLIQAAGGLSKAVARDFVAKELNLSKTVVDQEKVYLPFAGENKKPNATISTADDGLISINRATAKELQELKGVGEVTAQKIIAGRPYQSIENLKTVVSEKVFNDNFSQLSL